MTIHFLDTDIGHVYRAGDIDKERMRQGAQAVAADAVHSHMEAHAGLSYQGRYVERDSEDAYLPMTPRESLKFWACMLGVPAALSVAGLVIIFWQW